MGDSFDTPVALFVFNRPDLAADAMARLAAIRPRTLFVVADGPRNRGEEALCNATRSAVRSGVTWPAKVEYSESDGNLGCRKRIESGLDWVFTQARHAIILEDDIAVSADFFAFAADALVRYADTAQIRMISGRNILVEYPREPVAFLSRTGSIWGWASWADRWTTYRREFSQMDAEAVRTAIERHAPDPLQKALKRYLYDSRLWERIDTWDIPWTMWIMLDDGYVLTAPRNLTANLGMRTDATHTFAPDDVRALMPLRDWPQPAGRERPPKHLAYDLYNGLCDLILNYEKPRRWKVLSKQRGPFPEAGEANGWRVMLMPFDHPEETAALVAMLRRWIDSPQLDQLAGIFPQP